MQKFKPTCHPTMEDLKAAAAQRFQPGDKVVSQHSWSVPNGLVGTIVREEEWSSPVAHNPALYLVEFPETGMGFFCFSKGTNNDRVLSSSTHLMPYEGDKDGWLEPAYMTFADGHSFLGQGPIGPLDLVIVNDGEPLFVSDQCRTRYWLPKEQQ